MSRGHRRKRLTVERWGRILEAAGFRRVAVGSLAWAAGTRVRGETYLFVSFYTQERRDFERRGMLRIFIFYWPDAPRLGERRLVSTVSVHLMIDTAALKWHVNTLIACDRERVMREFPPHE